MNPISAPWRSPDHTPLTRLGVRFAGAALAVPPSQEGYESVPGIAGLEIPFTQASKPVWEEGPFWTGITPGEADQILEPKGIHRERVPQESPDQGRNRNRRRTRRRRSPRRLPLVRVPDDQVRRPGRPRNLRAPRRLRRLPRLQVGRLPPPPQTSPNSHRSAPARSNPTRPSCSRSRSPQPGLAPCLTRQKLPSTIWR